jgi:hypothetical protein
MQTYWEMSGNENYYSIFETCVDHYEDELRKLGLSEEIIKTIDCVDRFEMEFDYSLPNLRRLGLENSKYCLWALDENGCPATAVAGFNDLNGFNAACERIADLVLAQGLKGKNERLWNGF